MPEVLSRAQTAGMDGDALPPVAVAPLVRSSTALGYPPDARLLIVNCDDFGMYPSINAAVVEAIEQGIASSCSLMALCPAAPDAMRRLRRRPGMAFGIHLTLVCEMPQLRWGPMTDREKVPSLLDKEGHLFAPTPAGRAALLGQARLDEVEWSSGRRSMPSLTWDSRPPTWTFTAWPTEDATTSST